MVRELLFGVLKKVWNYTAATLHDIANVLELCPLKIVKTVTFLLFAFYLPKEKNWEKKMCSSKEFLLKYWFMLY